VNQFREQTVRVLEFLVSKLWVSLAVLAFVFLWSVETGLSRAQVVEENRPAVLTGTQLSQLPGTSTLDNIEDISNAPLGPDLTGIVFLNDGDQVVSQLSDTSAVDIARVAFLGDQGFMDRLESFIGQPISLRLVAEIRASVTTYYRAQGRAIVSVIVPPQDISNGVLNIVVLSFVAGEIVVESEGRTPADHIRSNIQQEVGEEIDTDQLLEDLNWLNQNPFRNTTVVFEPGQKAGETNLTLRTREQRPWSIYAGYANSGQDTSDVNRLFAGFTAANIPFIDHVLSYQFTASPDFFNNGARPGSGSSLPSYMSHSGVYSIPLPWRHRATFEANYTSTNSILTSPFTQVGTTSQVYGEYAIPALTSGPLRVEVYGAAEYKRQDTDLFFAGTNVLATAIDIFQIVGGTRGLISDPWGSTGYDVRIIYSPGNINARNSVAAFIPASGNPASQVSYTYFYGSLNRVQQLFGNRTVLSARAAFQWTDDFLPGPEKFSAGGAASVRGYDTQEASGDKGVYGSLELRAPATALIGNLNSRIQDSLVVYGFFDTGYVRDSFLNRNLTLAGIGAGVDYTANNNVSVNLSWGQALRAGLTTAKNDNQFYINAIIRY
jgi:hemolysin activation/secretion protein